MALYHVAYTIETLRPFPTQDENRIISNVRQQFRQNLRYEVRYTMETTFYKEDSRSLDDMERMIMRAFNTVSREHNASSLCDIKYDLCQVINGTQREKL